MSDREWHKATAVTVDAHGDDTHPAFGSIHASRVTSNPGVVLFDSDVQHQHFVRVRIGRMTRKRELGRDWLHATARDLIEVDMSEAQWASFVSSMNTTGVPCTLRKTETDINIPGLEFDPALSKSLDEVRAAADKAFRTIQDAMAAVDALDPKAGVKAKRDAMSRLRSVIGNASPNVNFAGKQLAEHAENVVQKARADVEAMVSQKAHQLGVDVGRVTLEVEA